MGLTAFQIDKLAARISRVDVGTPDDWETAVTDVDAVFDAGEPALIALLPAEVQTGIANGSLNLDRFLSELFKLIAMVSGAGVGANDSIDSVSASSGFIDANKAAIAAAVPVVIRNGITETQLIQLIGAVLKERA